MASGIVGSTLDHRLVDARLDTGYGAIHRDVELPPLNIGTEL